MGLSTAAWMRTDRGSNAPRRRRGPPGPHRRRRSNASRAKDDWAMSFDLSIDASCHVLHVGKFYAPSRGGMEKVLQVLCEAERGRVDSQVLVANDKRATVQESVNGVPVTRAAAWTKIGSVTVCPTLPLWMRRLPADVVVIHEPNPIALVSHAVARPKGRVVGWFHAEVVRPQWRYRAFYRPFLQRVLRLADRIIVASPQVAEQAAELASFRDKCVVIPYGIEVGQVGPVGQVGRVGHVEPAGSTDSTVRVPFVLFVGRMVPYKG